MKKVTKVLAILSAAGGAAYLAKKVQEAGGVEKFAEKLSKKVGEISEKIGEQFVQYGETASTQFENVKTEKSETEVESFLAKYKYVTDFSNWSDEEVNQFANDVIFSDDCPSKDPFWDDAAKCLLMACVKLLIDYCGNKITDEVGVLSDEVKEQLFTVQDKNLLADLHPDFASLQKLIRMVCVPEKPSGIPKVQAMSSAAMLEALGGEALKNLQRVPKTSAEWESVLGKNSDGIEVSNNPEAFVEEGFDVAKKRDQEVSELGIIFKNIENRFLDAGKFEVPKCVTMWNTFRLAPAKTANAVVTILYAKMAALTNVTSLYAKMATLTK